MHGLKAGEDRNLGPGGCAVAPVARGAENRRVGKNHALLRFKGEAREFLFLWVKTWKGRISPSERSRNYFLALLPWLSSRP